MSKGFQLEEAILEAEVSSVMAEYSGREVVGTKMCSGNEDNTDKVNGRYLDSGVVMRCFTLKCGVANVGGVGVCRRRERVCLSHSLWCGQHQHRDLPHSKCRAMMINPVFLAQDRHDQIKLQFANVELEIA